MQNFIPFTRFHESILTKYNHYFVLYLWAVYYYLKYNINITTDVAYQYIFASEKRKALLTFGGGCLNILNLRVVRIWKLKCILLWIEFLLNVKFGGYDFVRIVTTMILLNSSDNKQRSTLWWWHEASQFSSATNFIATFPMHNHKLLNFTRFRWITLIHVYWATTYKEIMVT
jgi:hypothetical protein